MTSQELSKMREAMIIANNYAMTFAHTDDSGSCNFDRPIIKINRLTRKQAESLPLQVSKCYGGGGWWNVYCALYGQANRRTMMAEAFARKMNELGFECSVYYMLD